MVNKLTPLIRFRGHTEDWEERKFGKYFDFPVTTNSLSRAQLNYDGGSVKSIHYGDILIGYNTVLDVKKDRIPYITDGCLEKYKLNLLKNRDIIFADAAEDKTVGKAVEVNNITNENVVAGLHTIVSRAKYETADYFLGYYINSDIYHKQLLRFMQGTKVSSISKKSLNETNVVIPKSIKEQTEIGHFFKQLDETIALQERKLNLLKELKKGYLQKMFPKQNEKIPELRFQGFTDAWEQRKLGDLVNITTGKLDANAMVEKGKYDFYTSGIKKYRIDTPAFKGPAITIAGNGATVGYMHLADGEFNAYQRTYVLSEFKTDRYFTFSEIGNKLPKKIAQEARTGNIPYIVMEMLSELNLSIPEIEEQIKIGNFFQQLDETLTLQEKKLESMKEMKKNFLQKLFV
ncbi:restriction endonuclease subunit S [Enterococcus sp. LJL98]